MIALVTGGSGFIGSHVVDRLRARGITVRVYDTVEPAWRADVEYHRGSVLDRNALASAMRDTEVVLHLAAVADVNVVCERPALAEAVNVGGTLNVLEAARHARVRKVIFASTVWVYGNPVGDVVDEQTPLPPARHLYTATKIAGEGYCHAYRHLYGLATTILRYGVPYGPRARRGAVVPNFTERVLRHQPMVIAGDGSQWRRFVYVEDLAEANALAVDGVADNRVYNLDGKERVTVRRVAETIRDILGHGEIRYTDGRKGDLHGTEAVSQRARRDFGWEPRVPFEEGVRRYIDWYRTTLSPVALPDVSPSG